MIRLRLVFLALCLALFVAMAAPPTHASNPNPVTGSQPAAASER